MRPARCTTLVRDPALVRARKLCAARSVPFGNDSIHNATQRPLEIILFVPENSTLFRVGPSHCVVLLLSARRAAEREAR